MIVTDRMVFLHLHKSGGTFVNSLLLRCVPGARLVGYHFPYREVPTSARGLPVLGTVRSPWAYYVSWYHFQAALPHPNILFRLCSNDRSLGFEATITNLLGLSSDEQRLELLEQGLPQDYEQRGLNLIKRDVADLRGHGGGFYSFLYTRLYAGAVNPVVMRTDQLRDELRAALDGVGHVHNACVSQFLAEVPPLNISRHAEPATYFDDRLAALVADRDWSVVERYGYTL